MIRPQNKSRTCAIRARRRRRGPWGRFREEPRRRSLRGRRNVILPGQYYDEETGLHYNYFRDYDAVTGRYIQSDPIGLAGGLSAYLYANANPISMIDPLGLRPLTQGERDFLRIYFGKCLDLDAIDLKPTRMDEGRQIFGNKIRMPQGAFKPDGELDLSGWVWGSHFAHEALHVWQRQNGRPVTLLALPHQVAKALTSKARTPYDPYTFDPGITDPAAMLQYFERSHVERQAAIFDSGVATHMQNGSPGRFRDVLDRVKNCGC